MSEKNYRSRKHILLVYPDDPRCEAIMESIKSFEHCYILHDKDKNDKGELKKSHFHVLLNTKNATWRDAISKEIGLPVNYIQQVRNPEAALEYLIHFNEETKFQYSIDDVQGCSSLIRLLKKLVDGEKLDEGEKVAELIEMIMGHEGHLTIREFSWYCAKNNRWDIFRRSGSIFLEIIKEKNKGV